MGFHGHEKDSLDQPTPYLRELSSGDYFSMFPCGSKVYKIMDHCGSIYTTKDEDGKIEQIDISTYEYDKRVVNTKKSYPPKAKLVKLFSLNIGDTFKTIGTDSVIQKITNVSLQQHHTNIVYHSDAIIMGRFWEKRTWKNNINVFVLDEDN